MKALISRDIVRQKLSDLFWKLSGSISLDVVNKVVFFLNKAIVFKERAGLVGSCSLHERFLVSKTSAEELHFPTCHCICRLPRLVLLPSKSRKASGWLSARSSDCFPLDIAVRRFVCCVRGYVVTLCVVGWMEWCHPCWRVIVSCFHDYWRLESICHCQDFGVLIVFSPLNKEHTLMLHEY